MLLATTNHHPFDDRISFVEDTHVYTIDGDSSFTSVTTFLHHHFPAFDQEKVAASLLSETRIINGQIHLNSSKYRLEAINNVREILSDHSTQTAIKILNDTTSDGYKQQLEAILQKWKKTSTLGTKTHADIESFYNKIDIDNDTQEFKHFINFNNDFEKEFHNYRPYRTEWTVFDKELKLAGSVDMIYENIKDGTLMIYDWKRVKAIEYESFGNVTATSKYLNDIPNSNFWHYSLQLNTYKRIIEKNYNKKVTKLVLVRLYPDANTYEIHECPDLQYEVNQLFEERFQQIS
jgi:hypothetical protein